MLLRPSAPAHGGAVVASEEGRTYFVSYALPGELVEAPPGSRRRGVVFTRAERVVEESPFRVAPPCPYFGACGGCQWQHAAYPQQLAMKRRVVEDIWARAGLRLPRDTPLAGMDEPWHYRIRGEFEGVYGDGGFSFGFHRARSHAVLPISRCPIHDIRINQALEAFRAVISERRLAGVQNLLLTVEPAGNGVLWRLRFKGPPAAPLPADFGRDVAERLPQLVLLDDTMDLSFWNLRFRVASDTFVQTNHRQMLTLYRLALDMLEPARQPAVLDLYAGIGTLSVAAAVEGAAVMAVESNPRAVTLARLNARINSAPRISFLVGAVEQALQRVRLGEYTAAILDPPRAGCEPAAIAQLLRLGPGRIVYISCEPSTHARDIAALVRGGYRVRRAAIVDMFPQTYHVETVALLERAP